MPKKTYNVVWDGGIAVNEKIGRISVTGKVDGSPAAAIFSLSDAKLASLTAFDALPDQEKRRLICRQLAQGHIKRLQKLPPQAVKITLDVEEA